MAPAAWSPARKPDRAHSRRDPTEADLAALVIANPQGRVLRLGDVAQVGTAASPAGAVTRGGKAEAVEGLVIALRGADARKWLTA
jgi:cobalt-zinc-cadmium resistance protein CzcA